jgi:thymidylate synthase (FAD)
MKLINQSAEFLPQEAGLSGIYKQIELAGRTSYLSWDKMTDDSAKKFVDMLIKSKHTSVLEHGTVYLKMYHEGLFAQIEPKHTGRDYFVNPYSKCIEKFDLESLEHGSVGYYITTNLRVLQENGWLDDLQYLCEPTKFHEKRLSVKVITDIGVTREFNRHKVFCVA